MSMRSYRGDRVKFDVHYPPTTPEIFVDGIDQTLIGFPHAKVIFYQTIRGKSEDEVSQRQATLRLVIPAVTLVEFCKSTLSLYSTEVEKFPEIATRQIGKIRKAVGLEQPQSQSTELAAPSSAPPKRRIGTRKSSGATKV